MASGDDWTAPGKEEGCVLKMQNRQVLFVLLSSFLTAIILTSSRTIRGFISVIDSRAGVWV